MLDNVNEIINDMKKIINDFEKNKNWLYSFFVIQ
jgi:hypothetical protein